MKVEDCKDCATCIYAFADTSVGFGGCAVLLEMPGTPTLTQEQYTELDEFIPATGKDCPHWKEDDYGATAFIG
jgi:hypothetical protein